MRTCKAARHKAALRVEPINIPERGAAKVRRKWAVPQRQPARVQRLVRQRKAAGSINIPERIKAARIRAARQAAAQRKQSAPDNNRVPVDHSRRPVEEVGGDGTRVNQLRNKRAVRPQPVKGLVELKVRESVVLAPVPMPVPVVVVMDNMPDDTEAKERVLQRQVVRPLVARDKLEAVRLPAEARAKPAVQAAEERANIRKGPRVHRPRVHRVSRFSRAPKVKLRLLKVLVVKVLVLAEADRGSDIASSNKRRSSRVVEARVSNKAAAVKVRAVIINSRYCSNNSNFISSSNYNSSSYGSNVSFNSSSSSSNNNSKAVEKEVVAENGVTLLPHHHPVSC